MRDFMVLIGELMFVAALQVIVNAILDEGGQKRVITVVNIACVLISYFLLVRYVYNHLIGDLSALVNLYF
ncbi:MAG: hypothetical protein FWC89_02745 [Defluviitaleaceae bacterium]|nr:hypothetical protein [Defluviitaleaceae bacterium]